MLGLRELLVCAKIPGNETSEIPTVYLKKRRAYIQRRQ